MAKHLTEKFRSFFILIITLSVPTTIYLVNKQTNFIGEAVGTKANLVIDLEKSSTMSAVPWKYLAQGGEEHGGMLTSVIDDVQRLSPRYIRIDHIYDFYEPVKKNESGELIYDWKKFDAEIEDILATGAKPFLSLSYMPPAISSGSEVDTPLSWGQWRELVQKTIEHVSGKENLAIDDVYYEVWNEPDLFGEFKLRGSKNYLTLYHQAALGAKDAKDTLLFKIGGPATTELYKNWFTGLLNYSRKNQLRLDFYSWHRYSKNISDYQKDIAKVKKWALNYPDFINMELIISEAGPNSEIDRVYDESFSAIHTISLSATAFNKIQKVFTFEIKDGPGSEKYWGRWGLLTHEKYGTPSAKPRYKAIEFLNQLEGRRYPTSGQGSWVKAFTLANSGVVKTLVVNYDSYNKHFENVPITFVNLPSRNFVFRRTDFLGETYEEKIIAENDFWSTRQPMQPNSAMILEIVPE